MLAQVSLPDKKLEAAIAVEKPPVLAAVKASMYATSADIDASGETYIVLYWEPQEGAVGYNLYRREKTAASFPATPVNGENPISSVKTCSELKAIIPEGSAEWNMLKNAF